MTNNEVLRSIQTVFDFSEAKMAQIYNILNDQVSEEQVKLWLKKTSDKDFVDLKDIELTTFLNALICEKRGKKEGPQPEPESEVTNNIILKKLKIALDLKNEDIIDILKLVEINMNSYELTSYFRKPNHKNYRPCRDTILSHFIKGLALKKQPKPNIEPSSDGE